MMNRFCSIFKEIKKRKINSHTLFIHFHTFLFHMKKTNRILGGGGGYRGVKRKKLNSMDILKIYFFNLYQVDEK